MVICYDSDDANPAEFGQVIKDKGFTIELVDAKMADPESTKQAAWKAPLHDDSPQFFRESFRAGRDERRPIIVDFWASWCGPCIQLKKITFADDKVKSLLEQCEVIFVDLDEHPKLAEFYGVAAVPDVFLINRDGLVVDRFQNYEPPERFRERVLKLLASNSDDAETLERIPRKKNNTP